MYLRALYLHNFRVYEEALFEFDPAINVISGPNARGKTSILEAINFLMTGRSFRTSQLSDMIRHGASNFYIEASFVKHGIEQKLRIHCGGKERRIVINQTVNSSTASLLGLLQGAVIHPDDAAVVKGPPEGRRHLLDLSIAQVNPLYIHHSTRYHRAMRQRNHLLRAKTSITIESWEHEMAASAAYLVKQRLQAVVDLELAGQRLHNLICGGSEKLTLAYKSAAPLKEMPAIDEIEEVLRTYYIEQFHKMRKREMELGVTLTGPHKDDMHIQLDQKDARFYASEGQQRSCLASLRLAEWELLKAISCEAPLLLIDDVGMSLDESRRLRLFDHLACQNQVFLTATSELPIQGKFKSISL